MSRITASPSISLDGFMAAPHQSEEHPLGVGGRQVHQWLAPTKAFQTMIGQPGGSEGIDNDAFGIYALKGGATIMGRNMFSPTRGSWEGSQWRGWWGEEPPFHHPVFVLTHFERPALEVGETTFHFVAGDPHQVLAKVRALVGDKDIHVGGGASTLRQFLDAGLIDEMQVSVAPVTLHEGERLFTSAGEWTSGYETSRVAIGEGATHYHVVRSPSTR